MCLKMLTDVPINLILMIYVLWVNLEKYNYFSQCSVLDIGRNIYKEINVYFFILGRLE